MFIKCPYIYQLVQIHFVSVKIWLITFCFAQLQSHNATVLPILKVNYHSCCSRYGPQSYRKCSKLQNGDFRGEFETCTPTMTLYQNRTIQRWLLFLTKNSGYDLMSSAFRDTIVGISLVVSGFVWYFLIVLNRRDRTNVHPRNCDPDPLVWLKPLPIILVSRKCCHNCSDRLSTIWNDQGDWNNRDDYIWKPGF